MLNGIIVHGMRNVISEIHRPTFLTTIHVKPVYEKNSKDLVECRIRPFFI